MTDTETPAPTVPRHPAKWSPPILDRIESFVAGVVAGGPYLTGPVTVLDVFAGPSVGIHRFADRWPGDVETIGIELEPDWAAAQPRTIVGSALDLRAAGIADASVDIVATSPCYGNRMADHHEARDACSTCDGQGCENGCGNCRHANDGPESHKVCRACKGAGLSVRHTYRHALGHDLAEGSACGLKWDEGPAGNPYRHFHAKAWAEVARVVRPYGLFLLNVSNHVRLDQERRVVEWHVESVLSACSWKGDPHGDAPRPLWRLAAIEPVETRRQRHGANGDQRVATEFVIAFRRQ